MSITTERDHADTDLYQIIATADWHVVPRMREVLTAVPLRSVMVSSAVIWSGGGHELRYRNNCFRADRQVARVEITCHQRYLNWVVRALEGMLAQGRERAPDALVVFPLGSEVPAQQRA